MPGKRLMRWLRSPWVTFGVLIEAVLLPAICVVWLIGRASENERAALQQAYVAIQQRETLLVRDQILQSFRSLMGELDAFGEAGISDGILIGCMFDRLYLDRSDECNEAGADAEALKLLDELRYFQDTFGAAAVGEQIRYWMREGTLEGLHLSGGRDLTGAMLLWGMELEGEHLDAFEVALRNYLTNSDPSAVEATAYRLYLLKRYLEENPADPPLVTQVEKVVTALKFLNFYQQGSVQITDRFAVEGGWVLRAIGREPLDGSLVWVSTVDDFKNHLLKGLGNVPVLENRLDRFEILEPGRVLMETEPLTSVVDVGTILEGWRFVSHLDQNALTGPAEQRVVIYIWVGVLTTLASVVFAVIGISLVKNEITMAQFKNDLTATVSHELKTPIASVRILVDTLLHGKDPLPPKTREYLELIALENQRLGLLVEKFLAFSKMERRNGFLVPEVISGNELVEEAATVFRERFVLDDCQLTVGLCDTPVCVEVDRQSMLSALGNLLENAYKYSENPREIGIFAIVRESHFWIEIRDNGEGVSPVEQKKIFRKFYQPDRRLNHHRGGVGLGLSIVAYVVVQHRAKIELESEFGKGSTFRIILPHAKDTDH